MVNMVNVVNVVNVSLSCRPLTHLAVRCDRVYPDYAAKPKK
jgi:hypothetical protein